MWLRRCKILSEIESIRQRHEEMESTGAGAGSTPPKTASKDISPETVKSIRKNIILRVIIAWK
jgi:hypothetical protein